jgi:hypothetical protein
MTGTSFDTLCAQANHLVDPTYGDVVPAVHISTTFVRNEKGELPGGLRYSPYGNPTGSADRQAGRRWRRPSDRTRPWCGSSPR